MIHARRTAAGLALALLFALPSLSACSSDSGAVAGSGPAASGGPVATGVPAASASAGAKKYAGYGSGPIETATPPAGTVFGLSEPVSIAYWWGQNPASAPADLADFSMLFEEQAAGPHTFTGPELGGYDRIMTVLTCTQPAKYTVAVSTAKNPALASTSGDSCGGPQVSAYRSPVLTGAAGIARFDVQVPATTKYYLTVYGHPTAS